jgi:glycerate dehydrogenase
MKDGSSSSTTAAVPYRRADLADALNSGKVYAAGLECGFDRTDQRGQSPAHCKNCLNTPHISWRRRKVRQRLMDMPSRTLKAFLAGKSQNVVNA